MKITKLFLRLSATTLILAAAFGFVPAAHAATITVNTTEESVTTNGNCSLREALQAAATNGVVDACASGAVGLDMINFNIGGGGAQTITATSPFVSTSQVTIDGTSQPAYAGTPLITITGAVSALLDFQVGSENSTVKGLQLTNTTMGSQGVAAKVQTNIITFTGNYFHTDGTNSTGGNNTLGVLLTTAAGCTVGGATAADRNLFGGVSGVEIDNGSNNTVRNNYFGVRSDGSTLLTGMPGTGSGILVGYNAGGPFSGQVLRDNVIGGFLNGIALYYDAHDNLIAGNHIGIGADGTTKLYNETGILAAGSDSNTIGGTSAPDRNVISGNLSNIHLMYLGPNTADSNVIQGNFIGTTADGLGRTTPYFDNSADNVGIWVDGVTGTQVGGTEAGAGNLISGNSTGIYVHGTTTGTTILGNKIGTDVTGAAALIQAAGISFDGTSVVNIGDTNTPGNNVISGNYIGISAGSTTGNTIYGNRIGLTARGNFPLANGYGVNFLLGSATLAGNWIGYNNLYGLRFDSGGTTVAGSENNCITFHSTGVVRANSTVVVPFTMNFWRNPSGPTHAGNPGGTGDSSSDYIDYSSFRTEAPSICRRSAADYDGDGRADPILFEKATGNWFTVTSEVGFMAPALAFGNDTSFIPVPGDYDGDGNTDPAVFEKATGNWFVIGSRDGFMTPALGFGNSTGFTAVPGDYDGDDKTDPAVFENATGNWFVVGSKVGFFTPALGFGNITDFIPVPADYDGDGKTDPAVFGRATGNWFAVGSTSGFMTPALGFGNASGFTVVPGDYDGDRKADAAVFEKATGHWFVVGSTSGFMTPALGFGSDTNFIVQPGDYDEDGKTDAGLFEKATGNWFVVGSTSGFAAPALGFGNSTSFIPLVRAQ